MMSSADRKIHLLMLQSDSHAESARRAQAALFTQVFIDPLVSAVRLHLELKGAFTRDRIDAVFSALREGRAA